MRNHLFIHPNFPGQFLHVARHLVRQGVDVLGVGEYENVKRQAGMMKGARLLGYKMPPRAAGNTHHYVRVTEDNTLRGLAALRLCLALKKEGYKPDVIAAHAGWGDTLFLREAFPDARISGYFEYYYRPRGADIGFDPEFRMSLDNLLEVRMKNATSLLAWEDCDVRWTPTLWQASLFPQHLKSDLLVQHEGIDTKSICPNPEASANLPDGTVFRAGDEILTFVNRTMEPYRGFHIFMRALPKILALRPEARVLITGMENDTSYGNNPADGQTWRQRLMNEVADNLDLSRVHFLGKLPFEAHLRVLQLSRVHVYLTYPYFVSWSMLEAMSAGCLVIGSRTPPVTEFIEDGKTGLLVDFFDIPCLVNRVCEALAEPRRFDDLRVMARQLIVERYDRDSICVPALLKMFEG